MTATVGQGAMVWRFVEYEARFGVDLNKGQPKVPKFVKWPLNAWDGPDGDVLRALAILRPEKNFIWLQGAVAELLSICTNTSQAYRGYLLSSRKEPASIAEIGSMLRIEGRGSIARTTAALKRMERAGLLERVSWSPPVAAGPIEDIKDLLGKAKKPGKKGGAKGRKQPKNEEKPLRIEKPPTEEDSRRGRRGAGRGNEKGPPMTPDQLKDWEAAQEQRLRAPQTPGRLSDPTIPTNSDAGAGPGGCKSSGRTPCPASMAPEPDVIPIGTALAGRRHRYSQGAVDYAERLMAAAGFLGDDAAWACERGHWTQAFERDGARLTPAAFAKVRRKALAVAARLRTGQTEAESPMRYLMTTWHNEVKDRLRCRQSVG
jgi:hypothetical protein